MELAIIFFIGLLLGSCASTLLCRTYTAGTLHIIKEEGESPYLYLELNEDVHTLYGKKQVNMKVCDKTVNSQK